MEIMKLSKKYFVRELDKSDIHDIYELCIHNTLYYEYCPPIVTEDSIKADMVALPPNTEMSNKYYIGFYDDGKLIAIMDLIDGYPKKDIAFIGFFMTEKIIQKQGIGSEIITDICEYLQKIRFTSVRLAWVKGNLQAEHFWTKNGFVKIKETSSNVADCVILAERIL